VGCYQDAARRFTALGESLWEATSLNNIGTVYLQQKAYAKALHCIDEALTRLRFDAADRPFDFSQPTQTQLHLLPLAAQLLQARALVLERRLPATPTLDQLHACARAYALAQFVVGRVGNKALPYGARKFQFRTGRSDLGASRIALCRRLFEAQGNSKDLETAFRAAEQCQIEAFAKHLDRSKASLMARVSIQLQARETVLLQKLDEYAFRLEWERNRRGQDETGRLHRLGAESQRAEEALAGLVAGMGRADPHYALLRQRRPCSLEQARSSLSDNEVALVFVLGTERSCLVLLEGRTAAGDRARGLAVYGLPSAEELADQVAALTDPETLVVPARARELGAQLYSLLLGPLAERVRGKGLVIVPDGALRELPFELLVEGAEQGDGGHYLVEGHPLRYAPSLTTLHALKVWDRLRAKNDLSLWVLADPVYTESDERLRGAAVTVGNQAGVAGGSIARKCAFHRMKYGGAAAREIGRVMAAAEGTALTGLRASEKAVRIASESGRLARARYVVFVVHGTLGSEVGKQPSLVLSMVGNQGGYDGFLEIDEVTNLRLNADLTVLIACYSGRGLGQAFLHAGSRGVVCALGPLMDSNESVSMERRFFEKVKAGQPSTDALRATKLEMIRAGKAPLYWAPFIIIGE
jgi:CHAT domain-containing protein